MFDALPVFSELESLRQPRPFFTPITNPLVKIRWLTLGRELARAAIHYRSRSAEIISLISQDPTPERRGKGDAISAYTATDLAGEYGNQVVAPCLLDRLLQGGQLQARHEGIERATTRHSVGMFLRSLHHEAGLQRGITVGYRFSGGDSGDPARPLPCERHGRAAEALARYEAIIRHALTVPTKNVRGKTKGAAMRRKLVHIACEICCWDRGQFPPLEIRTALDLIADCDGVSSFD